ncbi:uncharacterized protein LOC125177696, partial [Hyalella azteca]|uniref:Uncharacterized protein LOC125177696 n=1 Tax=Hyalella azteca TaxID=294128 RepID=A0A979FG39_HYAAZ
WFVYFFDGLTVVNAVVIGVSDEASWWDAPLEWCFLVSFLLEIFLKLITLGPARYFRRIFIYVFAITGMELFHGLIRVKDEVNVIDDKLASNNSHGFPMYCGNPIGIFMYVFAITGMELFHGLIRAKDEVNVIDDKLASNNSHGFPMYCGNPALQGTDFWRLQYCNNNFNDVLHAFIVLFELTVVNQWHVLAYGFSAVTHPSARLFFLLFHMLCVTLLLNVFTAFVLEVFLLEFSASEGVMETQLETKILAKVQRDVFTAFVLEVFLLEFSASEGVMETQLETKILALGLSDTRRKRKFSTTSHDELVMQDSDGEEDDFYRCKKDSPTSQRNSMQNVVRKSSENFRESDIGQIFKKRENSFNFDGNSFPDSTVFVYKNNWVSAKDCPEGKSTENNLNIPVNETDSGEKNIAGSGAIDASNLMDGISVEVSNKSEVVNCDSVLSVDKSMISVIEPQAESDALDLLASTSLLEGTSPVTDAFETSTDIATAITPYIPAKLSSDTATSLPALTIVDTTKTHENSCPANCSEEEDCENPSNPQVSDFAQKTSEDSTDSTGSNIQYEHECECIASSGPALTSLLCDTSVRFHLSKSVRSVEVLLQRMFQEELQQEYQRSELRRLSMPPQSGQ